MLVLMAVLPTCVSVVGLCSRIVGDLNWSIAIVRCVQSELRNRGSVYDLNRSIVRSFSGAVLLSESWFVFQS